MVCLGVMNQAMDQKLRPKKLQMLEYNGDKYNG